MSTPSAKPISCDHCGRTSPITSCFKTINSQTLCPLCTQAKEKQSWWVWLLFIILILLVPFFIERDFQSSLTLIFIFIIVVSGFQLISLLSIIITTKLVGGIVFNIHFGTGKPIFDRWINKTKASFGPIPFSYAWRVGLPKKSGNTLRFSLIVLSGLWIYGIVIAYLLSQLRNLTFITNDYYFPLLISSIIALIQELLPRSSQSYIGNGTRAGLHLKNLANGTTTADSLHKTYFRQSAFHTLKRKAFQETINIATEGLIHFPNDPELKANMAVANERLGNLETSLAIWDKLKSNPQSENQIFLANIYNNFAWLEMTTQINENYAQIGHEYSSKAYALLPWIPEVESTYAHGLIQTGKYIEGLRYADSAIETFKKRPKANESIASALATKAIGNFYLGQLSTAKELLKQAKSIYNDLLVIRRADTLINGN